MNFQVMVNSKFCNTKRRQALKHKVAPMFADMDNNWLLTIEYMTDQAGYIAPTHVLEADIMLTMGGEMA